MRRTRFEPLLHLILGAVGISPVVSCGGSSQSQGAGGTGGTLELGSCESPMPVGTTGWVGCDTGVLHRESPGTCPAPPPFTPSTCGECTDVESPWCLSTGPFGGSFCVEGCSTDADCAADAVCFCQGDSPGRCVPAQCSTDADCGGGSLCATYEGPPEAACSYFVWGVACQTPADQCLANECNCVLKNEHRECVQGLGGCGRPFLVEGVERVAGAVWRSDWSLAGVEPSRLSLLGTEERAALARHFTELGLMEHASIAAFARFTLELLALGAPAALVEESARALSDETRHAQLGFALATAYAGHPVGPGALAVDGCLPPPSLESVLRGALLEGCVGETVAAAEARELSTHTEDPVVADVLSSIAEDEGRHAALAFRFVRWALTREPALVRRVVADVLAAVRRDAAERRQMDHMAPLRFGVPTPAWRAALRRDVVEAVVAPCLAALVLPSKGSSVVAGRAELLAEGAPVGTRRYS